MSWIRRNWLINQNINCRDSNRCHVVVRRRYFHLSGCISPGRRFQSDDCLLTVLFDGCFELCTIFVVSCFNFLWVPRPQPQNEMCMQNGNVCQMKQAPKFSQNENVWHMKQRDAHQHCAGKNGVLTSHPTK
jgi:hypothetical protein